MTTYNTGNPIGSTDARDLYDNAQNLDHFVNGSVASCADRRGNVRRSLAGIQSMADAVLADVETDAASRMAVLAGIGYAAPVAYAADIALTQTTQTVEYNGEVYAPKIANLPFTTSGAFETAKFRLIQGIAATDLAASSGAHLVGFKQAGAGTVDRRMDDKARESVSVFDFMTEAQRQSSLAGEYPELTAQIQKALENGAQKVVFPAGSTMLTSGNEIPSNRHLIFEHGSRIKLKDYSHRPLFQNKNWAKSGWGGITWGLDSNITIEGLYMDGNYATQDRIGTGTYAGEYTSGLRFGGVTNLVLKDITIRHAKTFGIWVYAIYNLTAHNIRFDQYMGGTPLNQDGLHVNGPAANLDIRNIRGSTNDDMIALNADDGFLGYEMTMGPITDAIIDGVYPDGCLNGVRLLSATSRMDRVIVKNIVGTTRDVAVNQSPYGLGAGDVGSLTIENIDVRCGPWYQAPGSVYFSVIEIEGRVEAVSIKNVRWHKAIDNRPTILFGSSAYIMSVEIDGIMAFTDGSFVAPDTLIRWQGEYCANFVIKNINWFRGGNLAKDGTVLSLESGGAARGIETLVCESWMTQFCDDLIVQSSGYLKTLMLRNIMSRYSVTGSRIAYLASAHTSSTVVDVRDCYAEPRSLLILRQGSSTINPRSIIEPMGLSYFEAQKTAAQVIPSASWTRITFPQKNYDGADEYDIVSSSFQCQQAPGSYEFSYAIRFNSPTATTTVGLALYLNGGLARYIGNSAQGLAAGSDCVISGLARIYLEVNDVVELRIYASNSISIYGDINSTYWTAMRVF